MTGTYKTTGIELGWLRKRLTPMRDFSGLEARFGKVPEGKERGMRGELREANAATNGAFNLPESRSKNFGSKGPEQFPNIEE